jgi:hypothetical protein
MFDHVAYSKIYYREYYQKNKLAILLRVKNNYNIKKNSVRKPKINDDVIPTETDKKYVNSIVVKF